MPITDDPSPLDSLQEFSTHGKLLEQAPRRSRLGRWLGATVPKRWFVHFYLLGLVTSLLILLDMSILGGDLLIEPLQVCRAYSMSAANLQDLAALEYQESHPCSWSV